MITVDPTETMAMAALRTFLAGVLPAGTPIIRTVTNRVPEPKAADWVAITPMQRVRLSTNLDIVADCVFIGHVDGTVLIVESVQHGAITAFAPLFGVGLPPMTILEQNPNDTWNITPGQTIPHGTVMAAGTFKAMAPTEYVVQIDVHGPASGDNVQIISTLFRDAYGIELMNNATGVVPLYTSDPHQSPFDNDQSQMERRWSLDAHMQINPVVTAPQAFMEELQLHLIEASTLAEASTPFIVKELP